jgi:hypothetical protein
MSDASDIEELLGKHRHTMIMRKLWAAGRLLLMMASAFGGAAWTARGYLDQLATKDGVASLVKGQDEKFNRIDERLTFLGERQAKTESRVDDIRGTIVVRPR